MVRPSCSRCGRRMRWSKTLRKYVCPIWDHVAPDLISDRARYQALIDRLRRRHADERALYDRLAD